MQGIKRRILHGIAFEVIALLLSIPLAAWILHSGIEHVGVITLAMSLIALGWNMLFNLLFERWEARQSNRQRTVVRRVMHTLLFEGGLLCMTLPLIAWWMAMSLWQALLTDLGFMFFFLVYGFIFNWVFDLLFGLPKH